MTVGGTVVFACRKQAIVWLASERSDGVTGRRFVAARWRTDLPETQAAEAASDMAGWTTG